MLRSGLGVATLYAVRVRPHHILVPDTQREEIESRVVAVALKATSRIQNELSTLATITGSKPVVTLPGRLEVQRAIGERFETLASLLEQHAVSPELMRRALSRVITHRAPGGEKEQFRDALLWELALTVATERELHFVTDDGDFGIAGKLHSELAEDLKQTGARIHFYSGLPQLLRKFVPDLPTISVPAVTQSVLAELGRHLTALRGPVFNVGDVAEANAEAYVTERPDTLAVSFEIALIAARREQSDILGRIAIRGECMYHVDTGAVFDVRPECIVFKSPLEDSNLVSFGYIDGFSPEPRSIPYRVRQPLSKLGSEA